MMKQIVMCGMVGLGVLGNLAYAQVKPMNNRELAATVIQAPVDQQQQPEVPDNAVTAANGQIAGVAADALIGRTTPVVLPTAAEASSSVTNGDLRQLIMQLPVNPVLNSQFANQPPRNISQGSLR